VGDYVTKPTVKGGLGLGTYGASAVLALVMVGGVVWVTLQHRREQRLAGSATPLPA
jgi:uncharacterized membrane-anchored protein